MNIEWFLDIETSEYELIWDQSSVPERRKTAGINPQSHFSFSQSGDFLTVCVKWKREIINAVLRTLFLSCPWEKQSYCPSYALTGHHHLA